MGKYGKYGRMDPPPYLLEQIQFLRAEHGELCCRPNYKFTHVCLRDIGHRGKCGWDVPTTQRRIGESANLQQLWTEQRLPFAYTDDKATKV